MINDHLGDKTIAPTADFFQLEGRSGPGEVYLKSNGADPGQFADDDDDLDNIPDEYELTYHMHIQDQDNI